MIVNGKFLKICKEVTVAYLRLYSGTNKTTRNASQDSWFSVQVSRILKDIFLFKTVQDAMIEILVSASLNFNFSEMATFQFL
jgi:hypothetical protein